MSQKIIISKDIKQDIAATLAEMAYDNIFILTDENTAKLCQPLLSGIPALGKAQYISIKADDTHKTLEAIAGVWTYLSQNQASRKSLLINLGGGMVTDLGGVVIREEAGYK